jgi:hypothetical protein
MEPFKIVKILYFGFCERVSEIRGNSKIINLINNDFGNYAYFVFNEARSLKELEEIKNDIQGHYNFTDTLD